MKGGCKRSSETDWCIVEMPTLEKKLMKGKRNVVVVGLFIGSQF